MNKKTTPTALFEYWEAQHLNKDDIEVALNHIDLIISTSSIEDNDVPTIIHMIGIPGSGKSTLVNDLLQHPEMIDRNFFHLGFDRVMESLPAYQESVEEVGTLQSFRRWELPARISGYSLLDKLVQGRMSLVFDHTASDIKHVELLKTMRDTYGYRIIMIHPKISLETALERVNERNQKGVRFTTKEMVVERHNILLDLINQYKKHFTIIEIENENQLENDQIKQLITMIDAAL